MSQRRGCAGVGPLIGRAVRDARAREGGRARHSAVICERGPPQSVRLQPPTRKHSLLRVLKRSSGPPSARQSAIQRKRLIADSGLVSFGGPASPRANDIARPSGARGVTPRPYRRAQPASRAAARLRMEYEAARGACCDTETGRRNTARVVKKRLAMNLAEIEAATECDEAEEHAVHRTEDSASSCGSLIEHTTGSERTPPRIKRGYLGVKAWRTTPPEQRYRTEVQPGSVARREHSSERGGA
ncbi:hypothetical protein EVAR_83026_1 [Eumeta japonica]|uniref:Uncharacterized protein n=1 Tax=Eumeta variegata TaxID=151549 RepID=A0A4C1SY91_EUMVA|nr:hypothetical protein EVAR_83026_1 [Eumeta japonica]